MTVSAAMIAHLAGNVTFLCPVWKMTAGDGSTVGYAGHTRQLVIDSVTYKVVAADFSRSQRKIGLEPNTSDLTAPLDSVITEADITAGRWKGARIEKRWVNYLDLTMGGVYYEKGFAGKFLVDARAQTYTVEFKSLASRLAQKIGDVTQPTDARTSIAELGIDPTPYTHARTVASAASRQVFTVGGTAQADNYFRYGLATFTSGDNDELSREIKSSTGNVISLQYAMPYDIDAGDGVTLVMGYDSTRDAAKALGGDVVVDLQAFPDLPNLINVLRFPQ